MTERARVLIIDDDEPFLISLAAALADSCDVVTETSPRRALALLDTREFDVVCADLQMPEMSGIEVLERVEAKSDVMGRVLFTGSRELARESRSRSRAHEPLLKPFDPPRLMKTIDHLTSIARMRRAADRVARRSRS
jgi:DNA-binding NtrC family response regulator